MRVTRLGGLVSGRYVLGDARPVGALGDLDRPGTVLLAHGRVGERLGGADERGERAAQVVRSHRDVPTDGLQKPGRKYENSSTPSVAVPADLGPDALGERRLG